MSYAENPVLFVLAIAVGTMLSLYLLRDQAQFLIEQLFRSLQKQFRLLSKVCMRSEQVVRLRHYEVTKALVELLSQRRVERSYGYVERMVKKELAYYKRKAEQVDTQLNHLENDYQNSAQIPPPSPDWVAAVEAISQIETDERNSDVMMKILADMHNTIQLHQQDAMREHLWSVSSRHKLLAGLEPQWKKLGQLIAAAEKKNDLLQHKLRVLDQEMTRYELLTSGNGQGFMASILARFTIAGLLMTLAIMIGYYNAQLLTLALDDIGSAAAMSLPLLAMHGLMLIMSAVVLCEALGATHMLPFLASLRPIGKNLLAFFAAMAVLTLSLLSASWASGIGGLKGVLTADINQWSIAIMSFFACWLFAAVVIPFEYAVQTFRPMLSSALLWLFYSMGVVFRVMAAFSVELGRVVMRCYDAVIFLPLLLEKQFLVHKNSRSASSMEMLNPEPQAHIQPTTVTFNKEEVDYSNVTKIDFAAGGKKAE